MMKITPVFFFIISGFSLLTAHAGDEAAVPATAATAPVSLASQGGKDHTIHLGRASSASVLPAAIVSQSKEDRLRHIPANHPVTTPLPQGQELLVTYVIWTIPQKLFDRPQVSGEVGNARERFIQNPLDYITEDGVVCQAAPPIRIKPGETVKIPSVLILKYPEQWDPQGRPTQWTERGLGWECEVEAHMPPQATNPNNLVTLGCHYSYNTLVGYEEKPGSGYVNFDLPNLGKPFYPVFSTNGVQTQVVLQVGSSRVAGGLSVAGAEKESFQTLCVVSVVPAPEGR